MTTTTDNMPSSAAIEAPTGGAQRQETSTDPYSYLLLLRFGLLNLLALALLIAAWGGGLVSRVIEADSTHLVLVIAGVFVIGLALACWHVFETSREINRARSLDPAPGSIAASYLAKTAGKDAQSRQILGSSLRLKLSQRITLVRHIGNSLVFLGLIGTVIGFIIALSGIEADAVADIGAVAPMVSTLIDGMSVALFTTLVGAVFHVWLTMCYQVLATGTVNLANAIIETAETGDFSIPADIL